MAVEIGLTKSKTPLLGSISERRERGGHFLIVESLFVVFRGLGLILAEKKTPSFCDAVFCCDVATDTCGSKE